MILPREDTNTISTMSNQTTTRFISDLISFVRDDLYGGSERVSLHEPTFTGNEKKYVTDAIDSTFVSSVGKYVDRFEDMVASYTGVGRAVATMNGTAALHAALHLVGVGVDDLVITQPLTFIATANAIHYCGAAPVFADVDEDSLGLSPLSVSKFLDDECYKDSSGRTRHKESRKRVAACVPMHTFGFPMKIEELAALCRDWNIPLVEDAAESLGSFVGDKHTGTFGTIGVLSFNGNKTITTGGGGVIITNDEELGARAKHITTTAKVPHRWEYAHDEVGFNYRLPNLNAALGCAQMEQLDEKLRRKRVIANKYRAFMDSVGDTSVEFQLLSEREGTVANFWLNGVRCADRAARDVLLTMTNDAGIMTRPIWELMYRMPMYRNGVNAGCTASERLADEVVNLPSWPIYL